MKKQRSYLSEVKYNMKEKDKKLIASIILEREKLRPLSRVVRLIRSPIRTIPYYVIALASHIKPFRLTFKTLWGTEMTSYLPEGNTFYYYGYCEANLTNFLLRFIKEGDVVLDVGAHVGFYSMLTSSLVGDKGEVHSFEPTPWTYELLKKNTEKLPNVVLSNKAVSGKKERISFKDYGPGYGAYNTAHKAGSILKKNSKTIETETIALDFYCKAKNIKPNFIKLDAEGYELAILLGMDYLLEEVRPLVTLEVAGESDWADNCKKSIDFLLSKKYKPYEMSIEGLIYPHTIEENYKYDNLLFIPEERNIIL